MRRECPGLRTFVIYIWLALLLSVRTTACVVAVTWTLCISCCFFNLERPWWLPNCDWYPEWESPIVQAPISSTAFVNTWNSRSYLFSRLKLGSRRAENCAFTYKHHELWSIREFPLLLFFKLYRLLGERNSKQIPWIYLQVSSIISVCRL